jgi:endogenous inhibitor of DNA gyrase (YacG/DUF329 family)
MKTYRRPLCPICARAAIAAVAPFCSVRCKDEDLRRWLVGAYRVPGSGLVPEDDDAVGTQERRGQE